MKKLIVVVTVWSFWRERNNVIFRQESRTTEQIRYGTLHQSQEIINNELKLARVGYGRTENLIGWTFPKDD